MKMNFYISVALTFALTSVLIPGTLSFAFNVGCSTTNSEIGDCLPSSECPAENEPRKSCGRKDANTVCCPRNRKPVEVTTTPRNDVLDLIFESQIPSAVNIVEAPLNLNIACGIKGNRITKPVKDITTTERSSGIGKLIVGGNRAPDNAWPWMVLIGRRSDDLTTLTYFCGGALINTRYILSAAHCFLNIRQQFFMLLGESDLSSNDDGSPFILFVEEYTNYPNFREDERHHDLTIIKMETSIAITRNVRPICLPWGFSSPESLVGDGVTVTGWGITRFGGPQSSVLKEVNVTVLNSSYCQESYAGNPNAAELLEAFPQGFNKDTILCAGAKEDGQDACQGDSGGPLVHFANGKWTLAGIVSVGIGCGKKQFPGLYAPILNLEHLQWIKETAFS